MTPGFEYSEIGTWLGDLPDDPVASIGQDSDPAARFNFVVRGDPVDVNVIGPDSNGPLVITSTVTFPEEVLSVVRTRPDRFFRETSAIMASTPGYHQFTDREGNPADAGSFSALHLRHHVYPDGGDKHTVLTGVIDLLTSAEHLHDAGKRLVNAAGEP
ncbi:MAG: hypothetical protein ABEH88_02800 [Halobacteriales archaeon]